MESIGTRDENRDMPKLFLEPIKLFRLSTIEPHIVSHRSDKTRHNLIYSIADMGEHHVLEDI